MGQTQTKPEKNADSDLDSKDFILPKMNETNANAFITPSTKNEKGRGQLKLFEEETQFMNELLMLVMSNHKAFHDDQQNFLDEAVCENFNFVMESRLQKHLKVELKDLSEDLLLIPRGDNAKKEELCRMVISHYRGIFETVALIRKVFNTDNYGNNSLLGMCAQLIQFKENDNVLSIDYCSGIHRENRVAVKIPRPATNPGNLKNKTRNNKSNQNVNSNANANALPVITQKTNNTATITNTTPLANVANATNTSNAVASNAVANSSMPITDQATQPSQPNIIQRIADFFAGRRKTDNITQTTQVPPPQTGGYKHNTYKHYTYKEKPNKQKSNKQKPNNKTHKRRTIQKGGQLVFNEANSVDLRELNGFSLLYDRFLDDNERAIVMVNFRNIFQNKVQKHDMLVSNTNSNVNATLPISPQLYQRNRRSFVDAVLCGDALMTNEDYGKMFAVEDVGNDKIRAKMCDPASPFKKPVNTNQFKEQALSTRVQIDPVNPIFAPYCAERKTVTLDLKQLSDTNAATELKKMFTEMKKEYKTNIEYLHALLKNLVVFDRSKGLYTLKHVDAEEIADIKDKVKKIVVQFFFKALLHYQNILDFALYVKQ